MSTYWRFECLDHTPPLVSDDEFTQHTDDHAFREGVRLAHQRPLLTDDELERHGAEATSDYFGRHARRFLLAHPSCHLGLLNEYGVRRDLPPLNPAGLIPPVPAHTVEENTP